VHRNIELFHLPNLMHNSVLTICMLHYYPRHVWSINMPTFRRTNCILIASGIVALCKRLHSIPVKSGLILTICMLHYYPRHVSSISIPIFRRTNCILTAFGIVAVCKRLHSMPDESRLICSLLSSGIVYSRLQRAKIEDAVRIQFFLLKMGMLMFETCPG